MGNIYLYVVRAGLSSAGQNLEGIFVLHISSALQPESLSGGSGAVLSHPCFIHAGARAQPCEGIIIFVSAHLQQCRMSLIAKICKCLARAPLGHPLLTLTVVAVTVIANSQQ